MSTQNHTNSDQAGRGQRRYTNAALTVVACLLGVNALNQAGVNFVSTAQAQHNGGGGPGDEGLVSAAEQRKVMIAELRQMGSRLERMESAMAKPLNVKVIDMPPVKLSDRVDQQQPIVKDARKASK